MHIDWNRQLLVAINHPKKTNDGWKRQECQDPECGSTHTLHSPNILKFLKKLLCSLSYMNKSTITNVILGIHRWRYDGWCTYERIHHFWTSEGNTNICKWSRCRKTPTASGPRLKSSTQQQRGMQMHVLVWRMFDLHDAINARSCRIVQWFGLLLNRQRYRLLVVDR